ncbi:hypothetical protein OIU84_023597 [Salix udensis]|uniref:Uncharacterized protein n=1 Tax=Salix udensis TaxID=889485 RepID=A0AAD6KRM2_9ROSI|nr:hypothetical protein OIU84_023597 [Salix udensis]
MEKCMGARLFVNSKIKDGLGWFLGLGFIGDVIARLFTASVTHSSSLCPNYLNVCGWASEIVIFLWALCWSFQILFPQIKSIFGCAKWLSTVYFFLWTCATPYTCQLAYCVLNVPVIYFLLTNAHALNHC